MSARAIAKAPPIVRRHGLREAHSHPLVSHGKDCGGLFGATFRTTAERAWRFPSIELRSANAWTAIVFDCDGAAGTERLIDSLDHDDLPDPNWIVTRAGAGGSHAVYTLESPVLRNAEARPKPLRLLGAVTERIAEVIDADRGYTGVLTHNPVAKPSAGLATTWRRKAPHRLRDMARIIPMGWTPPAQPRTAVGRNVAVFDACMRWAGRRTNIPYDVLPAAILANDRLDRPLPASEIGHIAKSVERYRRQWIAQGRFGTGRWNPRAKSAPWASPEAQAKRGRKSGAARRARNAERDAAIIADLAAGMSQRAVAAKHGIGKTTVADVAARMAEADGWSANQHR